MFINSDQRLSTCGVFTTGGGAVADSGAIAGSAHTHALNDPRQPAQNSPSAIDAPQTRHCPAASSGVSATAGRSVDVASRASSRPQHAQCWFGESGFLKQSAQRTNSLLAPETNRKALATTMVRTSWFFQGSLCPSRPPVTKGGQRPVADVAKIGTCACASLHTFVDDASVVGAFGHRVRL